MDCIRQWREQLDLATTLRAVQETRDYWLLVVLIVITDFIGSLLCDRLIYPDNGLVAN